MSIVIEKYEKSLPKPYLDFVSKEQGFIGMVASEFNCYVDLWNIRQIDKMWSNYKFSEFLDDDWFPIGSNGGGEMIAIQLTTSEQGLYFIPFIGMSNEEPVYFCESFLSLYEAIKQNK